MNWNRVIGISVVSGGGKTAVTRRLAEVLGDAVALHFDDYDNTNIHPEDRQSWFAEGADYDAYETPVFSRHLQALKDGQGVCHPIEDTFVGPARYVVADAPLGRTHADSGQFIDLMVFIDTPLDIAMARRIRRNMDRSFQCATDETLQLVKGELSGYESRARAFYLHFQLRLRSGSDLIVDGTLSIDLIVQRIRAEMESRWGADQSLSEAQGRREYRCRLTNLPFS